nr:immunoglobulin light chain junction region [Macaca mulatta]
CMQGLEYPWTC